MPMGNGFLAVHKASVLGNEPRMLLPIGDNMSDVNHAKSRKNDCILKNDPRYP